MRVYGCQLWHLNNKSVNVFLCSMEKPFLEKVGHLTYFILEKQCTGIKFICINFNGLIVLEIRHGLCTTFILENVITVS